MATCTDTLARASETRSKQGTHELEISFGGELDLHKHFQYCTKNPGHLNFVPINSLDMHHLPDALRTMKTFAWIQYIAKRTVKLSVRYVSLHRQPPLPLSDYAGQDILSVGSGFMSDICLVEGKHEMPCPFDNCPEQPGQHQVYGYIIITTAAHVVFDDDEAKNTTVEFFYDNPKDRSNVRTARGVKVGAVSVEGDFCEMLCVTHDRQLLNSIENAGIKEDKNVTLTRDEVRISCSLFQDSIHTSLFSGAEVANVVNGNIDLWELQCVTHDKQLFDFLAHGDHQQNVKAIRYEEIICDLFQMFPCIKYISARDRFLMSDSQELSVNISLDNVLSCAELLVLLLTYNIETIVKAMCTIYYNRYLFSDNEEIYINKIDAEHIVINDKLELNTSLMRRQGLYFYTNILVKHEYLALQLKTLLMEVPINVDCLNDRLTESEEKETQNRIVVRQIGKNMLKLNCRKFGNFDNVLDEYLQRSNIEGHYNEHGTSHNKLVVHISHPHGQSKQISFGTQTDCFTGNGHYKPLYTAPTCPGCSGGPVWMISVTEELTEIYGVPHGGCHDNQLNHGCSWTLYPHES